jgi:hypothetical protein
MSPSRGTHGETMWSDCSKKVVASLNQACLTDTGLVKPDWDHDKKYFNFPGLQWSSDDQCKLLLRDMEAKIYHPSGITS